MNNENNMNHALELEPSQFGKAAGLFGGLEHHISIQGVITGVLPGSIFLSPDGSSAVMMNPQGLFVGGRADNTPFFEQMNGLLPKVLLPRIAARGRRDYVLFYPSDEEWAGALSVMMRDLLPMRSGRMTFSHTLEHVGTSLEAPLVPVDGDFLARRDIAGLDEVLSEIAGAWPSLDAFIEQGFGCAALQPADGGWTLISWCLTDWVVGTECEFGIFTEERFRRSGWAVKTASGALTLAKLRGMTRAGWQCWSSNIGSSKTALSAGFRLAADFPVLFGWCHPLNNLLVNGNHYMLGDASYGVHKDYARAAWSYAQALDQGWDWSGDAALYWNAACMFYKTGDVKQARHFYKQAVDKGWRHYGQPHYHPFVYRETDSESIARMLGRAE
ncbi:tetratricopeptide repeat protein [Paenibacillus sp. H1-7]|uniref:GNAT family N-acetyltransferase n=1 Tax=Paenibacillus sp. H1-7 TaxID=2282849 RepID=UPI001EF997AB|nr:GNAT family N-acetyltransferase [Paenibacillus sp. H1-7]ULL13251.1 tetratricopeptide repeat protein [Paenibacillus sp. H1-7]